MEESYFDDIAEFYDIYHGQAGLELFSSDEERWRDYLSNGKGVWVLGLIEKIDIVLQLDPENIYSKLSSRNYDAVFPSPNETVDYLTRLRQFLLTH